MEKKIFCSALMPLSLMENPEERCENCREYYPAADVYALLQAARALVEAVVEDHPYLENSPQGEKCQICQAIAAVEAIISPQRSSPPPADTGKA